MTPGKETLQVAWVGYLTVLAVCGCVVEAVCVNVCWSVCLC